MVNGGKLFMMGRRMSASIWWSGNKGGFGVRFTARVRAWAQGQGYGLGLGLRLGLGLGFRFVWSRIRVRVGVRVWVRLQIWAEVGSGLG